MKVWDLPLRVFHWAFMFAVIGCFISGKNGIWFVHERMGMTVMALVIFRIIWGFIGSETARFSQFLKGPSAVLKTAGQMLKGDAKLGKGHSAVGGYATLILLAIPLMMALSGSVSTDDILFDGPFYHLMPEWSRQAGRVHYIGHFLIMAIVAAHLGVLAYYWFRLRKNLIGAMVTGRQKALEGEGIALSGARTAVGFVIMIALIILAQWAITLRPEYF